MQEVSLTQESTGAKDSLVSGAGLHPLQRQGQDSPRPSPKLLAEAKPAPSLSL